jgi:hypothetical protein
VKNVELHDDGAEFGVLEFQPYFLEKEVFRIAKRGGKAEITFMAIATLVGLWMTFLTVP